VNITLEGDRLYLLQEDNCAHGLYLTSAQNREAYLPLYKRIGEYLDSNYSVLYATEGNPADTIQHMKKTNSRIKEYVDKHSLKILRTDSIYHVPRMRRNPSNFCNVFYSQIRSMQKKKRSEHYAVFGSPEPFIDNNLNDRLVEYEKGIAECLEGPIEIVCCYSTLAFNNLTCSHIISLLNAHNCTIHTDQWIHSPWTPERIIGLVKKGIDDILGSNSGRLITRTMQTVYGLDEEALITNPTTFEEKLRKLLGEAVANKVIRSISSNLTSMMTFECNLGTNE
jgi:DcmR-like sensory protein